MKFAVKVFPLHYLLANFVIFAWIRFKAKRFIIFLGGSLANYWLCITNEKNWEIIRKRNIWGVPKRSRGIIQKVKTGDLLIFYVAPKRVASVFKAVSEPYVDEEAIFNSKGFRDDERFSHRVRLEPVVLAKEYVDFSSLIP
jgi:predicted RNA-binding protein